jgi:hypothetical protein
VETIVAELAGILAARDTGGLLIYDEREVTIVLALLSLLEGGAPSAASRRRLETVYRWAGIHAGDDESTARKKLDRYLEADPLHPVLLRSIERALRVVLPVLADRGSTKIVGSVWALAAKRQEQLTASRGSVLAFRLEQGRHR